jgi:hypothetical protein
MEIKKLRKEMEKKKKGSVTTASHWSSLPHCLHFYPDKADPLIGAYIWLGCSHLDFVGLLDSFSANFIQDKDPLSVNILQEVFLPSRLSTLLTLQLRICVHQLSITFRSFPTLPISVFFCISENVFRFPWMLISR